MKRPEFNVQVRSQEDGSVFVQAEYRHWPNQGNIPDNIDKLTPEERNRLLEAHLRHQEDAQHRTNVMLQGLALIAQTVMRKNEPAPDNVVRGPWKGPGEPACTHPGCVFIVTHSFGGYPMCTKHYSEAYDTFVREEEDAEDQAAETEPEPEGDPT